MLMSDLPLPLDWDGAIELAAREGRLMALLKSLPRVRWTERGPADRTLLHYASMGNNMPATLALLAQGLD